MQIHCPTVKRLASAGFSNVTLVSPARAVCMRALRENPPKLAAAG